MEAEKQPVGVKNYKFLHFTFNWALKISTFLVEPMELLWIGRYLKSIF